MNPQQQGPVRVEDVARQLIQLLPAIGVQCEYFVDVKDIDGSAFKIHRINLDGIEKFKMSEAIPEPQKLKETLLENKTIRDAQDAEESKVLTVLEKIIPKDEPVEEPPVKETK